MADLTIGEIIALAHDRASIWESDWTVEQWQCACGRAPIFYGRPTELKRCTTCGRPKPPPRVLGTVTEVDHERKTITVSGLPNLRGPVVQPPPLTAEQITKWTWP